MKQIISFRKFLFTFSMLLILIGGHLSASAEEVTFSVNINTATAEEIAQVLDGVGESKAAAIVSYRETHGSFNSLEELTEVRGIGQATVEKNKAKIQL